jgi:hypothetical protein
VGRGLAALSVVLLLAACGGSSGNGLVFVFQDSANDTDADKVVHVFCPSGKKALGGGYEITGQDPAFDYIATEGVNGNVATGDPPNGWVAAAKATADFQASGRPWAIGVSVTCGDP